MRVQLVAIVSLLFLSASLANAQDGLCDPAKPSTVDEDAGVIVQTVMLSGKWGRNAATVYLPAQETAAGAVVLSHSSVAADGGSIDLHPLALTLARAGAAVIVPERSLLWLPADRSTNREGAVVRCAAHWIIDHTKVFNNGRPVVGDRGIIVRKGYAYVGPRICDPAVSSDCQLSGKPFGSDPSSRYRRSTFWMPFGETEGNDSTAWIISDGGLRVAHRLQQVLGLAPIRLLATISSKSGS